MHILLLVVAWVPSAGPLGWFGPRRDQPPPHPTIGVAYYFCPHCRSLAGGLWGKGGVKRFHTGLREACVHEWREVSRSEFKALAVEIYEMDWLKEERSWWNVEERSARDLARLQGAWQLIATEDRGHGLRVDVPGTLHIHDRHARLDLPTGSWAGQVELQAESSRDGIAEGSFRVPGHTPKIAGRYELRETQVKIRLFGKEDPDHGEEPTITYHFARPR